MAGVMRLVVALSMLVYGSHAHIGHDIGFSIFFGNDSNNQDNILDVAEAGVQYININQTFLSPFFKLQHTSPDPSFGGTAKNVSDGLFDICSHVDQNQISAMLVTRDKCPECDDIAGAASHVTSPIMAVDLDSYGSGSRAFKMYPSAEDLNNLFIDVLTYYDWRDFVFLYDDQFAYNNLRGMINHANNQGWIITSIRLTDDLQDHFDRITSLNTRQIFIYCSSEGIVRTLLDQAHSLELLGPPYNWIIGNLNAILLDDSSFVSKLKSSDALITHFQMNYTRPKQYYLPFSVEYNMWNLQFKLAFDAVIVFSHGLRLYRLWREQRGQFTAFPGDSTMQSCVGTSTDAPENTLTNFIKKVKFEGLTGKIAFDDMGNRVNYTISIYSGKGKNVAQPSGEWIQNTTYWEEKWNTPWTSPSRLNDKLIMRGSRRQCLFNPSILYSDKCCRETPVTSEEIYFELGDTEINEYIITGERNVMMRCGFTYLPRSYIAEIIIEHNGVIVADNNGIGRSTSYAITGVTVNDAGNYSCTVYGMQYYGCEVTEFRQQSKHHTLYSEGYTSNAVELWYSAFMVLLVILGTLVV